MTTEAAKSRPDVSSWEALARHFGILTKDDYAYILEVSRKSGGVEVEKYCEARVWQEVWSKANDHPAFPSFMELRMELEQYFVSHSEMLRKVDEFKEGTTAKSDIISLWGVLILYIVADQLSGWLSSV